MAGMNKLKALSLSRKMGVISFAITELMIIVGFFLIRSSEYITLINGQLILFGIVWGAVAGSNVKDVYLKKYDIKPSADKQV
jgi:hypothetical protein